MVKHSDFSLDEGKAQSRNERGGRRLPKVTPATVLKTGACGVLSDGSAGQAAEVAGLDGRPPFMAAVERLLLLQDGSLFRGVVTFL